MKFNEPTLEREMNGGFQKIWDFENGYSASVVRHDFSYGGKNGLWELAILKDGEINYDTGITDDVMGHLSEDEVLKILARIKNLK